MAKQFAFALFQQCLDLLQFGARIGKGLRLLRELCALFARSVQSISQTLFLGLVLARNAREFLVEPVDALFEFLVLGGSAARFGCLVCESHQ